LKYLAAVALTDALEAVLDVVTDTGLAMHSLLAQIAYLLSAATLGFGVASVGAPWLP
jgi:hypothetical protein